MAGERETEQDRPSSILYEIRVTPTEETVNSFKWIKEHPGTLAYNFTDAEGNIHNNLYSPLLDQPRYRLCQSCPKGLPSRILLMKDVHLDRLVIAKHQLKSLGGWGCSWGNPFDEAHKAAVYEHPYIAAVHSLAADKRGDLYIIMEYLPNGNLDEWIEKTHNLKEIRELVYKLSSALSFIHTKKRLVYGDMKPRNVAFDANWDPKIIDFEISEFMGAGEEANIFQGTLAYEAPEQSKNQPITPRADIYSLAATIFSIFTCTSGKQLYSEALDLRQRFENNQISIPFTKRYNRMLSIIQKIKVSEVLKKALNQDPKTRYASVCEFNQDFQQAIK